ncbi:MAG: hypothetical protein ACXWMS_02015 [Syntrophales bacterium]
MAGLYFFERDSRHNIYATTPATRAPTGLIQRGIRRPSKMTSHPKKVRRICMRHIKEKMPMAKVVNGFMVSLPSHV